MCAQSSSLTSLLPPSRRPHEPCVPSAATGVHTTPPSTALTSSLTAACWCWHAKTPTSPSGAWTGACWGHWVSKIAKGRGRAARREHADIGSKKGKGMRLAGQRKAHHEGECQLAHLALFYLHCSNVSWPGSACAQHPCSGHAQPPREPYVRACLCAGEALWDINDTRTWKDADGEEREPPMPETANLYLQARGAKGGARKDSGETLPQRQPGACFSPRQLEPNHGEMRRGCRTVSRKQCFCWCCHLCG